MAELGNSIVNKIFEQKIEQHIKPGPEATRIQREAWILKKYKEKAFVDQDVFTEKGDMALTVSRLRRRARVSKRVETKEDINNEDKEIETCEENEPSLLESVLGAGTLARANTGVAHAYTREIVNAENVLFGDSLRKHPVATLELESDQASYNYWQQLCREIM